MATDFSPDAVLVFLQRCGGSARNTELLAHFLPFLRDKPDNAGNRDRFKSFVNSVATVSKIDGVSTVTLRKKYRGYVSGAGPGPEPGPDGASLSPAGSLAPPGDTDRNPALPAAGIAVPSGTRLNCRENPSPEPVQVGNRVPELSVIPYQSKTEEQSWLGSGPGAPAVRHQDYVPEPIRWQEMPLVVPAPSRRQEGPHQDRFPEPIRGQDYGPTGGHTDYAPRPPVRQEPPHQDFPHMPSRRMDKPHQRAVPEPARGHIVGRQDHAPILGERWDPTNQGTVSEPNKGRIISRQDHAPDPIRGQKTSHQNRVAEPLRGHVGNRQDYIPGPVRGQQALHQSPFPGPNRRRDVPQQDPRGYVISRVPEPIRGQNVFYQDPSRAPLRGSEVSARHPTPQPPRGQQHFYQVLQNPEHLRGGGIPYQDPTIPEYLSGQQISQNLEPLRGQWIPNQVPQIPEPLRVQEISYEDPVPEAFRGQNIYYQDPIPEHLSGHQIPQNIELRRGQQVLQNPEPRRVQRVPQQVLQNPEPLRVQRVPQQVLQNPEHLRVQRVPQQIPEHLRGQEVSYEDPVPEAQNIFYQHPIPEYLSGHQVPQNLEPLRGQKMSYDPVQEPIRGQEIYFPSSNTELHRGQKIPYKDLIPEYLSEQQNPQNPERLWTASTPEPERNLEPLRRQQVLKSQEPLKGQRIPKSPELRGLHQNSPEPLQGQQIPQSQKPLKGQQVPQNLEPLKGQQFSQSPELHKVLEKNPEPLQVPQNLEPLKRQQISQSPELRRVHQKNLESPKEQQIPQNLEPLNGQQVPKSPEQSKGEKISFQDPVPESPKGLQSPPQDPEPVGGHEPAPQLHQVPARRFRNRQSYRSAVSQDDDYKEEDVPIRHGSAGGAWPLNAPLSDMARATSASSPCITESPAPPSSSLGSKVPQIYIQNLDGEVLAPRSHSESESRPEPGPVPVESVRRSLPLEAEFNTERHHDRHAARTSEPIRAGRSQRLSSSQGNICDPPSDERSSVSNWPPSGSSRTCRAGDPAVSLTSLEVLQESNRTEPEPPARRSNLKMPLHQSMGNLCDDLPPPSGKLAHSLSSDHLIDNQHFASRGSSLNQSTDELFDMKSSNSSIDSPRVKVRSAAARRMSSRLRNRICRSLGTDLDQDQGDGGLEDARLEQIHRVSSSQSLPHHLSSPSLSSRTPPRCRSPIASEGGRKEARKSLHSAGKSAVPLEALEHDWMVKAAAGDWTEIYALFRADSSLLNRQDFISGFTVLHWMAKHGDHRVINTLCYGVEQKGLSFNVNAKSTAGQTPLHIAAMHGHKNIIRLLVKKFGADMKLRDTAGKKAWQYLKDRAPDILEMLAAPPKAALTSGAENDDPAWKPPKQRRHLRHHFSTASSGQRPQTLTSRVKVSRSTSIAALLKPKALQRF